MREGSSNLMSICSTWLRAPTSSYWILNVSPHECSSTSPLFFFFLMGDWSLFTWCISTREDASIQRFSSSVVSQIHLEVAVDLLSKQQLVRGHILRASRIFLFLSKVEAFPLKPILMYSSDSLQTFYLRKWTASGANEICGWWREWRLLFTSSGRKTHDLQLEHRVPTFWHIVCLLGKTVMNCISVPCTIILRLKS